MVFFALRTQTGTHHPKISRHRDRGSVGAVGFVISLWLALCCLNACGDSGVGAGGGGGGASGGGGVGGVAEGGAGGGLIESRVKLAIECDEPTPYSACIATLADGASLEDANGSVEATIGGVVTPALVHEGVLAFLIPPEASGLSELEVQLAAGLAFAPVDVESWDDVANPDEVIDAALARTDAIAEGFEAFLASPAGLAQAETATAPFADALSEFESAKTELLTLEPEQRVFLANFIAANPGLAESEAALIELLSELSQMTGTEDSCKATSASVDAALEEYRLKVATAFGGPIPLKAAVVAIKALVPVMRAVFDNAFCVLAEVIGPSSGGPLTFTSDQPGAFPLTLTTRNIQPSDAESSAGWLAATVQAASAAAPFLASMAEITATIFSPLRTATKNVASLSFATLSVQGSALVTGEITGTPAAVALKFHSDADSDENITFSVHYARDEMEVQTPTQAATVKPVDCFTNTSNNTTTRVCRDPETGFKIYEEECSFNGSLGAPLGTCEAWRRREYGASEILARAIEGGKAGTDTSYSEREWDTQVGTLIKDGYYEQDAALGVVVRVLEIDLAADTCRRYGSQGSDGCDSGTVTPATACVGIGSCSGPGGPYGFSAVEGLTPMTYANVTVVSDGLCGTPSCPTP